MAKLTAAQRKKIPKGKFAGPGETYPVEDKAHAANAKARATQMNEAGKLSDAAKAKIDAAANKVLAKGKTKAKSAKAKSKKK